MTAEKAECAQQFLILKNEKNKLKKEKNFLRKILEIKNFSEKQIDEIINFLENYFEVGDEFNFYFLGENLILQKKIDGEFTNLKTILKK